MRIVDLVGGWIALFECEGYAGGPRAAGVACVFGGRLVVIEVLWEVVMVVRMRMPLGGAEKMSPTRSVTIAMVCVGRISGV